MANQTSYGICKVIFIKEICFSTKLARKTWQGGTFSGHGRNMKSVYNVHNCKLCLVDALTTNN